MENNDDLICPITLERFRDPVIAGDGRAYEREAITRWILEHGTSPFTRQALQIHELVPDDHLRHLANQRRPSTISDNVRDNPVLLPPLRVVPTRFMANNTVVATPIQTRIEENVQRLQHGNVVPVTMGHRKQILIGILACMVIVIPVIIIISFAVGFTKTGSSATGSNTQTTTASWAFQSSLSRLSPTYSRLSGNTRQFYYQAIQMDVLVSGFYSISTSSTIDTYGYLYSQSFNPRMPATDLLQENDDGAGRLQFLISLYLNSGHYILVVTTYAPGVLGAFSVSVSKPEDIILY